MQISIVGCGWLGKPLALKLRQAGHTIVATCRSAAKQTALNHLDLNALQYNLGDALDNPALQAVFNSSLLILNIPPGGKHIQAQFYADNMCALLKHAQQQGISNVIFISTTAVYGDIQGEVSENSPTAPSTLSGQAHLAIEQTIRSTFADSASILRPAGLVGQQRHPATYLAGKAQLSSPQQKVNLVHQDDVINAISAIIAQQQYGQIFHLSAHEHPSRKDYYQWACGKLGLAIPHFINDDSADNSKTINAHWTCETLGMQLLYPSPFDML